MKQQRSEDYSRHGLYINITASFFSSPVGSLCHTRGIVRRLSSVVRRVSSESTITTRNN